jgi:hypothetical protein
VISSGSTLGGLTAWNELDPRPSRVGCLRVELGPLERAVDGRHGGRDLCLVLGELALVLHGVASALPWIRNVDPADADRLAVLRRLREAVEVDLHAASHLRADQRLADLRFEALHGAPLGDRRPEDLELRATVDLLALGGPGGLLRMNAQCVSLSPCYKGTRLQNPVG